MTRRLIPILLVSLLLALPARAEFSTPSSFPPNPASAIGRYGFDLALRIELQSDRASGPLTLLVNSRDGSMALDNPHASLWALGMEDIPGLDIHHVLFRAGEFLVCGRHPMVGEACLQIGGGMGLPYGLDIGEAFAREFYESLRWTDQDGAPVGVEGTGGLGFVHGRGSDGTYLTFWFDPGRSTVDTTVPFLGPGVGIAKDYDAGVNRVARHFFVDFSLTDSPVRWAAMQLVDLSHVERRIDLSRYRLIDAFSLPGLGGAIALAREAPAIGAQVREFEAIGADEMAEATAEAYWARVRAHAAEHGLPTGE
ncbi:hypothetical protein [Pseudogemmobacter sonorensis]|uniref:hypothetical protein n=1 Tax=Pseudogemmobacter sonorensis TaxID=2989681 RepID=UPI00369BE5BD